MKKILFILCWAFSMYASVECRRRQPFMAGTLDRIKAVLRLNRRVGHIVVEIKPTESTFRYYEFSLSRIRKRLRLLDTKVGTINFNLENVERFKLEADSAVKQFKKVVKVKAKKVSVSAIVSDEHKYIGNPHDLCKSALEAFGSLGYYVKNYKCLSLNANSKILLLWYLLNGGFQKFKKEKYYPIVHLSSDLAGVAFPVSSATDLTGVDDSEIFTVPFYGTKIYASGSEILGVDQATARVFEAENKGVFPANCQSECLHSGSTYHIQIRGANYTITGKTDNSEQMEMQKCSAVMQEVVKQFKNPLEIPGQTILSVSSYYRRYGAAKGDKKWRAFSKDVLYNCEARCTHGDYNKYPKQCMDSIYAYTLLRDYFRVPSGDEILNFRSLYSQEVHWTLSVAFLNIYQRYRLKLTSPNLSDTDE